MAQSRRWCFTLNNYTDAEYLAITEWGVRYMVIGMETGETGTPHIQGFVIFNSNKRLTAVKELQHRAHWEIARGSTEQASDYCMKDGCFEEYGQKPQAAGDAGGDAEKQRWVDAKMAAIAGDLDDIPDDIYIRYYRTLKDIKRDHMPDVPDADETTGVWLYGAPGVGKSRMARADFPGAYLKMQNKWWDGYTGQDFVILDDFDCKELGHHLKIWADRYSFIAETKGGAIKIRPKKIIVTSNYHPKDDKFKWDDEMVGAILRRFKVMKIRPPLGAPPSPERAALDDAPPPAAPPASPVAIDGPNEAFW